jgi:hypothetical protein
MNCLPERLATTRLNLSVRQAAKWETFSLSGQTDILVREENHSEKAVVMSARKRKRRKRTHDWQEIVRRVGAYEIPVQHRRGRE